MFLLIEDLLSAAEVATLAGLAQQARFVDGRLTNPHNTTKKNVIADASGAAAQQASQIGMAALQRNEQAMNFTFAARIAPLTLCRYGVGMTYGAHTDAAHLAVGQQALRSDLSCTVFLSEPGSYRGASWSFIWAARSSRSRARPAPRSSIRPPRCTRSRR